jgi:HK97 family phage major capsid protein
MAPTNFAQPVINTGWQTSGNPSGVASVDLSRKEQGAYSICAAVNASLTGDWSNAGLERAASKDIARQIGREPGPGGIYLPANLAMRAPYAVGASSTGGSLVATNLLAGSFIEVLRNKARVFDLGPTLLTGLVGNVSVPRQTTATSSFWVTENGSISENEATFDTVSLTPRTVGALSTYSRLMLLQSTPDIEMIVRNDLAAILALAIDKAALSGTGTSNQPTGVLNTTGVGSLALGTNGGTFDLDAALNLRKQVAKSSIDTTGGAYLVTELAYFQLVSQKASGSGEYVFSSENGPGPAGMDAHKIHGCPVPTSQQLPSNGTKGSGTSLSTAVFGRWSDLLIGQWGALEILPNPYGSGFNSGSVDIRAMQTIDVAVRHPESFAACKDIAA